MPPIWSWLSPPVGVWAIFPPTFSGQRKPSTGGRSPRVSRKQGMMQRSLVTFCMRAPDGCSMAIRSCRARSAAVPSDSGSCWQQTGHGGVRPRDNGYCIDSTRSYSSPNPSASYVVSPQPPRICIAPSFPVGRRMSIGFPTIQPSLANGVHSKKGSGLNICGWPHQSGPDARSGPTFGRLCRGAAKRAPSRPICSLCGFAPRPAFTIA